MAEVRPHVDVDALCSLMWKRALSKVVDAVVFADDVVVESLHWQCGDDAFFLKGAVQVREFSSFEAGPKGLNVKKAVFISSKPFLGSVVDTIRDILANTEEGFTHVVAITTIPASLHHYLKFGVFEDESNRSRLEVFQQFEEKLVEWMDTSFDKRAIVASCAEVLHIPALDVTTLNHSASLCLMLSRFSKSLFPFLDSDLDAINDAFMADGKTSNRAEAKVLEKSSDIGFAHLPSDVQTCVKVLVGLMNSLFDNLAVTEEVFSVGPLSRVVAAELANLPMARTRRKNASGARVNKASVIFVDRTVDLATVCGNHGDDLLTKLLRALPPLPGHSVDVSIDLNPLLVGRQDSKHKSGRCQAFQIPGCLSTPQEPESCRLFHTAVSLRTKDSLSMVHKTLNEKILKVRQKRGENIALIKTPVSNKATTIIENMEKSIDDARANGYVKDVLDASFIANSEIGHLGIWQMALACIETFLGNKSEVEKTDSLLSIEKALLQTMPDESQVESSSFILGQLLKLMRGELDKMRKVKSDPSQSQEMVCLSIQDLILLLVFVYSLCGHKAGTQIANSDSEDKLKALFCKLIEQVLQDGSAEPKPLQVRNRLREAVHAFGGVDASVENMFAQFHAISRSRDEFKSLKHLFEPGSLTKPANHQPFLQQLLQLALSEPNPHDPTAGDCPDIEHHSSGMLKDLLKSSFSYFMGSSVAKPKPSDAQFILIFVVGGVTPSEIRMVNEQLSSSLSASKQVSIWSNKLLKPDDVLKQVLQPFLKFTEPKDLFSELNH